MNGFKVALLTIVAVLLLIVLVDQWRRPEQLGAMNRSFQDMAAASQAQTEELRRLRTVLETKSLMVAPPVATPSMAQVPAVKNPVVEAPVIGTSLVVTLPIIPPLTTPVELKPVATVQNGIPKLDVNFLLPLDRSYIDSKNFGGVFRGFSSSPKGLNPIIENESVADAVQGLCNESMCDRDDRHPELWSSVLADSVIISDDYKIYTFKLHQGIRWQKPSLAAKPEFAWLNKEVELTAADFVFAMRVINDPKVDCGAQRSYFEDLDHCEAIDPYTVRMVWKKKVYTSLSASLSLTPLPKHIYGANRDGSAIPEDQLGVIFNKHWFDEERGVCGVGPYVLSEFVPDKVMRFRRNPTYWTTPPQHNDGYEWNLEVKQDDAQLVAFKNGQATTFSLQPLKYKSEILDHKEARFAAADPTNPKAGRKGELGWELTKRFAFSYIGWNNRRPYFLDKRVRQAMSHAFPKERLIRDVFMGLGEPILSGVHPDNAAYNRKLQPYAFDLVKAKALLAEAGWRDSDGDGLLDQVIDGRKTDFRFNVSYYANSPEWDNALAIYRGTLKEIGIEMTPKPSEWKELLRVYQDRDFDAVVGIWGMDWETDFYQLWHSSQIDMPNGSNHCGFSDAQVDSLAVKLRETFDVTERKEIIDQVQAILHDAQPYTFFMSPKVVFAWQNHRPDGSTEQQRYLDGVVKGFEELNPLRVRTPVFWYYPK